MKYKKSQIGLVKHFKGTFEVLKTDNPFQFQATKIKDWGNGLPPMPIELIADIDEDGQLCDVDKFRVSSYPNSIFLIQ
jgi:hypothetical protein